MQKFMVDAPVVVISRQGIMKTRPVLWPKSKKCRSLQNSHKVPVRARRADVPCLAISQAVSRRNVPQPVETDATDYLHGQRLPPLTYSCQASAKDFQHCAEFPPLRNRSLRPLGYCPFRSPEGAPLPRAPPLALSAFEGNQHVFGRRLPKRDQRLIFR